MIISFIIALAFHFIPNELSTSFKLVSGVFLTTLVWLIITLKTKAEDITILKSFYQRVHPGGPGWEHVRKQMTEEELNLIPNKAWDVPQGLMAMIVGSFAIYLLLFTTGFFIYGETLSGAISLVAFLIMVYFLKILYSKLNIEK